MILWPFKLAVSAVLWFFHTIFTSIGMDPSSGFTWVLCIICLTLVMRAVTIPLFMRQIKSMRGMNAMQGDLAKLQAKYKGKKDQLSRQAMAQEQMALFKYTYWRACRNIWKKVYQCTIAYFLMHTTLRRTPLSFRLPLKASE